MSKTNPIFRLFSICWIILAVAATGRAAVPIRFQESAPRQAPSQAPSQKGPREPLTVAESSDFTATSTSAEAERFIDECVEHAPHIKKIVLGQSVEGRDLVGVVISQDYYELGDQDDRNVILVVANIHPGECSGKEGVLMLLRELAFEPEVEPNRDWLSNNVIIMVPNYNADSNDRMGLLNRPGQIGPVKGMGRRENAQELDLNRDFGKLEAPETRALVKLMNQVKPTVFVDCHTTNGSRHRYSLTYDIPHNPATAEPIRQYMRNQMMPALTESMEAKGQSTFYYGNFSRDQKQWLSYGHEPRYSTEYAGLRGSLAILVEDYSYLGYQERIVASKEFVASIFDYVSEHHSEIKDLIANVEERWRLTSSTQPYRIKFSLSAKPTPFGEKVRIKGFKNDRPQDLECEYVGNYTSTRETPLPYAYVIPKEQVRVIDRLRMHGIVVQPVSVPLQTEVEIDTIKEIKDQPIVFQKHRNRTVETTRKTENQLIEYGDMVVLTEQPLGRLAAYLLEPTSDDGFVFWNFFDDDLAVDSAYPVLRLPEPIGVVTDPEIELVAGTQLSLDSIDGPNSLLSTAETPPSWFGKTNLVNANFSQRPLLLDARTASFAARPALAFDRGKDRGKLQTLLIQKGLERSQVEALLSGTPLSTIDGQFVLLTDGKRSFAHWTAALEPDAALLEIGTPKADIEPVPDSSTAEPGELFEFNQDESKLAFVTSTGLHVLDLETRKQQSILAPSEKHLIGKLDWVYQEELYGRGNFKGFWWNPSGNEIAFLSLDESRVPAFTVMDHLPIRGKSEVTNYPKAGDPLPVVKLGVIDANRSAEATWVQLPDYGTEDILISRVTWSQNGEVLLVQIQNREQTWLDLVAVSRQGELLKVLFRDQTPAWIESPGDPVFVTENEFLWISPRDGLRRIYRYDLQGKLIKAMTEQNWEVRELLGVDPQYHFAYFTGSENPSETHGHRIRLSDGQITQITQGAGTHQLDFSHDYSLFLDRFSNTQSPIETRVCQADGVILRKLNVRSDDRLDYLHIAPPEFISMDLETGKQLDAMLIKPPNFSEFIRYPILIHVYAGPQAPRVRNRFDGAFYLWHQMLAQQGYVVVLLDNSSSSLRNSKDAWPVHRQLAKTEMEDIEAGVNWLKGQSWVDSKRFGIWGWSYGGYMTLYALTHSKSFKMGISGAPVTDWKNYDAIYTERYMGLPQDNPAGYEKSSILGRAKDLHGKLFLVHGTIDDNVHLNNSLQFVKEMQDAGIVFDLMLYPANRHAISQPKQAAHLRKLMTEFILKHL